MKTWKLGFTPEASRNISGLHPDIKRQLKQALNELRLAPHGGKDLLEELAGFKSLRTKQYRIIYDIDEEQRLIQIHHIGRRRDVYEQFRRLLSDFYKSGD